MITIIREIIFLARTDLAGGIRVVERSERDRRQETREIQKEYGRHSLVDCSMSHHT